MKAPVARSKTRLRFIFLLKVKSKESSVFWGSRNRACFRRQTLLRDWDRMITFYEFPKQHWVHLRTTNIVESPFDMVRLRTNAARRFKRVENATAMIWKLLRVAEKAWRHLKGSELLQEVYDGQQFADGIRVVMKSKAAA